MRPQNLARHSLGSSLRNRYNSSVQLQHSPACRRLRSEPDRLAWIGFEFETIASRDFRPKKHLVCGSLERRQVGTSKSKDAYSDQFFLQCLDWLRRTYRSWIAKRNQRILAAPSRRLRLTNSAFVFIEFVHDVVVKNTDGSMIRPRIPRLNESSKERCSNGLPLLLWNCTDASDA